MNSDNYLVIFSDVNSTYVTYVVKNHPNKALTWFLYRQSAYKQLLSTE